MKTAKQKFAQVVKTYLSTGDVKVEFDKQTLITTLNGVPFTPEESESLNNELRDDAGYRKLMTIVNSSPVAQNARDHVNVFKTLQDKLAGDVEEDLDFEEDLQGIVIDDEDEDGLDGYVEVSFEDFLKEVGGEDTQELFHSFRNMDAIVDTLEVGEKVDVEIPSIGKATLTKISEDEVVVDVHDEEAVSTPETGKSKLLNDIQAIIKEAINADDSSEDADFLKAKEGVESMPKEIVQIIKAQALAMLQVAIIELAKAQDFNDYELNQLTQVLALTVKRVDSDTGDKLPVPVDFLKALGAVIAEQF